MIPQRKKSGADAKAARSAHRMPWHPTASARVVIENGWFAARPSGTENIYKIYAESFRGEDRPRRILQEAQNIVNNALVAMRRCGKNPDPLEAATTK
jgi:phosphoglucomutase